MTERLPFPLSERLSGVTDAIFARQGREVDVAIGGIPFRLATSQELPYSIATLAIRKDQVDTERDPGEQSLAGWWRRSQSSFHEGAGSLFQENNDEAVDSVNFYDSRGVDVFTPGKFQLIKKMVQNSTAATVSRLRLYWGGSAYKVSGVKDGALWTSTSVSAGMTSLHAPVGKTIVDGVVTGASFYDVASDGTLYEGTVASPGTATSWACGGAPTRLQWGKHRLWVIGGRSIWQPDLTLTAGSTQSPIFTNPNQGWTYTCLTEGPAAMYFGGHDGQKSTVQVVALDTGGAIPTLSGASVTAALPESELVQELDILGGQYIGIGTNQGFRVGVISADGAITYGPLIIEPSAVESCTAVTTQGRFFLVAFKTTNGTALTYRVDTGTPLDGGIFPYAADVELSLTGYFTSLAAGPIGTIVGSASDGRVYYQSATDYVSSGYLQTGRIRFRTTERKFFRSVQVETEPLAGSVKADAIIEGGSTLPVANLTEQGVTFNGKYPINSDPLRYLSMKFTLVPSGALTASPTILTYQVTALPAVKPQRTFTVPLLCYDQEQSLSGQWYGGKNFAADRYNQLTLIEDQSDVVTYQDFSMGDAGRLVTIEGVRFIRTTTSPVSTGSVKGSGGIILLELRTAED